VLAITPCICNYLKDVRRSAKKAKTLSPMVVSLDLRP
jgi:hypothetical protein